MKHRRFTIKFQTAVRVSCAFISYLALSESYIYAQDTNAAIEHFHPEGKAPSKFTIELRDGLKATLPFEDKRDFEEAKKYSRLRDPAGNCKPAKGNIHKS